MEDGTSKSVGSCEGTDLPDAAVVKVGPDVSVAALAGELQSLLGDDGRRRTMAAAARAHAETATFAAAAGALLAALD